MEIADELGWPRSSTFNLINTLVSKGYFYEPRARGAYYPSIRWRRMANAIADAEPLPAAAELAATVRAGAARGYHVSAGEVVEDLVAIATPLSVNGRTLALLLSGPMFRCVDRIDAIGQLLIEAANRCRAALANLPEDHSRA